MVCENRGPIDWSGERDSEGHRTYKITFLIKSDFSDGPYNVMRTPGTPVVGSVWAFNGDLDPYAYCRIPATVERYEAQKGEKHQWWSLQFTFTTKGDDKSCKDQEITNPLLEPADVSVSTTRHQEEATHDRFGKPIMNSCWEQLRGPQVEFDSTRVVVKIKQNVGDFYNAFVLPVQMRDCLNNSTLWGQAKRCVKLTGINIDRKFYGQCLVYYSRSLEFEIRAAQSAGFVYPTLASVVGSGTGYINGEIITLPVGKGANDVAGQLKVTALDAVKGGGAISRVSVVKQGVYSSPLKNPVVGSTSSGAGTGASFTLAWTLAIKSDFDRDLLDEGTKMLWGHWVKPGQYQIDQIDGQDPDPLNPAHFKRAEDPATNPCRLVLNGGGLPAGVIIGSINPNLTFISLANANLGHPLTDKEWWLNPTGQTSPIRVWDFEETYVRGNIVSKLDPNEDDTYNIFIATDDPTVGEDPLTDGEGGPSPSWLFLRQSISPPQLDPSKGEYSSTEEYLLGDIVESASIIGSGTVHVEKYPEANFLLLGIPIAF